MVYAGAVAAGAFAGAHVVLFGHRIDTPAWAYVDDGARRHDRLTCRRRSSAGGSAATAAGRCSSATARWLHLTPDAARPRRALVRPLRRLGRARSAGDAARALLRLDPGRGLRGCRSRRYTLLAAGRLGDLVLRPRRRRLGARHELRRFHHDFRYVTTLVVGVARGGRGRLPDLAQAVLYTGAVPMIPLVDVKAQYAPLIPELKERIARGDRVGPLHPRARTSKAFEEEAAAYLGVPADDRRRQRHRRARARRSTRWGSAPATR